MREAPRRRPHPHQRSRHHRVQYSLSQLLLWLMIFSKFRSSNGGILVRAEMNQVKEEKEKLERELKVAEKVRS